MFAVEAPAGLKATASGCTTGASGTCTIGFTATTAGTYAIRAELGSSPVGAEQSLTFVAGPVDPANSALSVSPGLRTADGVDAHTATVTARDSQGNPVDGVTVDFVVAGATGSGSAVTGADGKASVSITATAPGSKRVTASIGGTDLGSSPQNVGFTVGAPDTAKSTLTVTGSPTAATRRPPPPPTARGIRSPEPWSS